MNLSRKWLSEFVSIDASDREFAEAMTLSGSKVELTHNMGEEISNVVVGRILSMERHPDSDHMWVCQLDAGGEEPLQIVTGAWNIHEGDLVPVALHGSTLPGGKHIQRGKLRGMLSDGMMCGLDELGLDERDFPYAAITAAAILGDYKPTDPAKPSIPADIQPGHKIFGPVVAAGAGEVKSLGDGRWSVALVWAEDGSPVGTTVETDCQNIHSMDLVAFNTKTRTICTLADLHAEQREFPHCIPDGIFVLQEDCKPGDDIKPVTGLDDHVVEFEITPNRPDCLSVIGLAREAAATFDKPLALHTPEVKGGADGVLPELLDVETPDADLVPRYTARMVRNVKIAPSPKWMRERLRAMGVRPINNIVDITNYVMLEYGQPMHAFDYRYVNGGKIIVRRAAEGEKLTTLDGKEPTLMVSILVWGVVGYFAARMLLDKSFRVLRYWKGAAAVAGVFTVLFLAVGFDLTGFETRVPDASQVASVELDGGRVQSLGDGGDYFTVTRDDPEFVGYAIALHRAAVNQRGINPGGSMADTSLTVTYHLKNGSTLSRRYYPIWVDPEEAGQEGTAAWAIQQMYDDRELYWDVYGFGEAERRLSEEGWRVREAGYEDGSRAGEADQTVYFAGADALALYEAVKEDFQAGRIGVRRVEDWDKYVYDRNNLNFQFDNGENVSFWIDIRVQDTASSTRSA